MCGREPAVRACIWGMSVPLDADGDLYADTINSNLNLLTMMTRPKEQSFYMGLVGLVYGTGCILGPIVGGTLSDSAATWRWVSQAKLDLKRRRL